MGEFVMTDITSNSAETNRNDVALFIVWTRPLGLGGDGRQGNNLQFSYLTGNMERMKTQLEGRLTCQ